MPFGCPALDALDDVAANREEAQKAAERIARRDSQARVLPPGSRDDLATVLACLERIDWLLRNEARPEVAAMYQERIGR